MNVVIDVVAAVLMTLGVALTVSAAVGVLRFPDLLSRLHAVSKPQSVGLLFMMAGYAINMRSVSLAWAAVLIVLFQLVTAPVSAHLAARSGYRTGQVRHETLVKDEYRRDLAASLRAQRRREAKERAAARGASGSSVRTVADLTRDVEDARRGETPG